MIERVLARPRPMRMLLVTAVWGSCFVVIDWGLRDASALWLAAFRALLAGAALLAVAKTQHRLRPDGFIEWGQISVLALFNVTLAVAAMFAAAEALSAGVASVLSNAQPLLILLPAWWLFAERPRRSAGVAAAVGFVGLAIAASASTGTTNGSILAVLAAIAITTGTLLARRMRDVDIVVVSAWHFVIGGAGLVILASVREGAPSVNWTPRFIASVGYLALIGTAGAFVLWFIEVRRAPLASVALWTFLTPVFGLSFSALVFREFPTGRELGGVVLVLAGVAGGLAWPSRDLAIGRSDPSQDQRRRVDGERMIT